MILNDELFHYTAFLLFEFLDDSLFGITVHGTDMLQPHALLQHPMVRVYIINVTTGQYIEKSDPTRPASFCDENVNYILPIMTHPYDFKQHRSVISHFLLLMCVFVEKLITISYC